MSFHAAVLFCTMQTTQSEHVKVSACNTAHALLVSISQN
jgi:hypothetical protein